MKKQTDIATAPQGEIENRIFEFRGMQVMLDRDLAELYGVEVKRLNEQVKRNLERFPDIFRFQLSNAETQELVAICDRFKSLKYATVNPYAFTEQGVVMLSAILRSETAVQMSIQIVRAFVAMRKILSANNGVLHRLEVVERKQLETDHKFEQVFQALENPGKESSSTGKSSMPTRS
jgi:phage regulator Rha-like protein